MSVSTYTAVSSDRTGPLGRVLDIDALIPRYMQSCCSAMVAFPEAQVQRLVGLWPSDDSISRDGRKVGCWSHSMDRPDEGGKGLNVQVSWTSQVIKGEDKQCNGCC